MTTNMPEELCMDGDAKQPPPEPNSHMDRLGQVYKRWLGRSRLVAREHAFLEKRDDTYSPAASTHTP